LKIAGAGRCETLKTLKISAVVTVALTLAWWFRLPHRMWPMHPMIADLLIGIVLCILLQVLWNEPEASAKK
jgi:hypothetical protein